MDLAELQSRVDRLVKLDLGPLYERYRAHGGGDVDGFLAYLGATRALDPSLLAELHGLTDVETPSVGDPAYQGTLLAAWAKTRVPTAAGVGPGPAVVRDAALPVSEVHFASISRLGEGAMGAVDIARDVYLRRKVALKTVLPAMAGHPEVVDRFLCEMQITAQLEHPNIVPVYALDVTTDGALGYAMKLVQGRDLATILQEAAEKLEKGEPLGEADSLDKRLEYFVKVCDALEYAHSKGVVHRDLKPANIMIGRHNEVYLMDWGIARLIGADERAIAAGVETLEQAPSGGGRERTRLGDVIGTPSYMSPEQAAGKNLELEARSDEYSMGLILQECVTLRSAVDGPSIHAVLLKAVQGLRDPAPIGNALGEMPREIDAIVRKATQKDPSDRYRSVRDLADDVRRFLRGEAVLALPEGALRRAGRWLTRHRMATLTLLLAIGLVGAGGTIGALVAGQARIDAAHARELRVAQMAAESAIQTQLVDRDLTRYEAALSEFVGAAQIVVSKLPPSDIAPYFEESFSAKETAPPDFGPSKRYGRDTSVLAPLTFVAAGTARAPLEPLLGSLALLAPAFRALLLASSGADWRDMPIHAQRTLIADVGVPAFRASLALREGVTLSFPGTARAPEGDPRESAAFMLAEGKAGVVWGPPTITDGESTLPASAALHDERGAFRGVALLEISLNRLLARTTGADLDYVLSRSLVGRDGTLMAEVNGPDGRVPLAPEVAAAIAAGQSGTLVAEVNGHRYRYAFHPLSTLDWYDVVVADEGRIVDSHQKLATSDPRRLIAAASSARSARSIDSPPPAPPATSVAPVAAMDGGNESRLDGAAEAGQVQKHHHTPKTSATPNADAPLPPNPFEKWKAYERKKP
jgi:serine/threonine protein kinase